MVANGSMLQLLPPLLELLTMLLSKEPYASMSSEQVSEQLFQAIYPDFVITVNALRKHSSRTANGVEFLLYGEKNLRNSNG